MTTAETLRPRFLDSGDGGLTVEFGREIDAETSRAVVALAAALDALAIPGVVETVPTYRSLLVLFDPAVLPRARLVAAVTAAWPPAPGAAAAGTRWRVPVRYGGEHGVDLPGVAAARGLTEDEVVRLHAGAEFRVYMIGFAPGFTYLGGLPERLHTSRRRDPRLAVPPCSVSIGGAQGAVGPPLAIPSGWHLLGRTPVLSYDPRRGDRPCLFSPGDLIRFAPIGEAEYAGLAAAAAAGDPVARGEPA